jgi:predicted Holliday junction resolvase-like endonuclease
MSDVLGWVFTLGFMILLVLLAALARQPKQVVLQPEIEVALTFNGLTWNVTAKWENLKDREMAKFMLVKLAEQIEKQEALNE